MNNENGNGSSNRGEGFSDNTLFGSANLFTKYLDKGVIFKNRDVLTQSYAPNVLPHRKEQIDSIAAILAPAIRNETPSNILIYGKTGTGKTSSVNYVGAALETACHDMGKACNVIYLNCERLDTQYRLKRLPPKNLKNSRIKASKSALPRATSINATSIWERTIS